VAVAVEGVVLMDAQPSKSSEFRIAVQYGPVHHEQTITADVSPPRFLMSTMASSRTQSIAPSAWLDDWVFTTEGAILADVAALNSLLALPAVEGLVLDYPDE
jgi:hypothetical protein